MIQIGILNIMHDKTATKNRFDNIFRKLSSKIELTYYYPIDHYRNRPVPSSVKAIAKPLNLSDIKKLDAFIITGAPIERKPFSEITYLNELNQLLDVLDQNNIEQLYMCWGAMAALHHFYKIDKRRLSRKVFGVYRNIILKSSPLVKTFKQPFLAPHARYEEVDHEQVNGVKELQTIATTLDGLIFLNTNLKRHQSFLFAHLEYGKSALNDEYQRELRASSGEVVKPQNYFETTKKINQLAFSWQPTQQQFFENWLQMIEKRKEEKL